MPVRCIVYVGLAWLWALYGFFSVWMPYLHRFHESLPPRNFAFFDLLLPACAEMAYGLGFIVIAMVVSSVVLERYKKVGFESRLSRKARS